MIPFKNVIFDFNGTLFWDTPFHNQAWDRFLQNHQIQLTDSEKNRKIHGKNNQDILRGLFHTELTDWEMQPMIAEKESIYQQICLENGMDLAPGAAGFLDFLLAQNIAMAIATASEKVNIDFYNQHLNLATWFTERQIVYNDGSFRGKPHPDIFLRALQRIRGKPEETAVFEDSLSGIQAAGNAGLEKIIIVNSYRQDYGDVPYDQITHFDQVDRRLFL